MKGVLLLTAVLLALAADPAAAAFPGTNGRIAMEREGAGGSTIATVNADGTGDRNDIVKVGPLERDASWAPDGRRLAFTSTRAGNSEIYVYDTDNGAQTRLTFDPADDRDPTWSPDGTRLAFASDRSGNWDIYVMPASGGPAAPLTTDPATDRQPAWSATGTIAFASDRALPRFFDLYSMDERGQGVRRLTQDPEQDADPSWSPDGSQLAFAHKNEPDDWDVLAVSSDGQHRRPLAASPMLEHFPSWSPDGTRVAYVQGATSVVVIPADGTPGFAPRVGTGTDPNWGPVPAPEGPPDVGRTVTVAPAGGAKVLIAPATSQTPSTNPTTEAKLRGAGEVPVGTTIDASEGTVGIDAVTTTPDGPGTVGHADITGGVFSVTQVGSGEPTMRLIPAVRGCQRARAAALPPEARMRIRARGRFRTVTGYGRASARGTEWSMRQRCDGTLFKVYEGVVAVHDFRRKVTFRVRAGQCYLAAVRRRPDALRPKRTCPRERR